MRILPNTQFDLPCCAETRPKCPLQGASCDSITHFDRKIITLDLTNGYFDEADQNIVEYSEFMTTENDKSGIHLDARMLNHPFTIQLLDLWDFESMAVKLLSQVRFPGSKIRTNIIANGEPIDSLAARK